ncbi:50S ribosomal protein L1 [Buchnera aphidicola]|uniref:50S ribosomal protein L1 n=1 Tax=Buchnera aphidicola TaxID=9 RepID=UPI0031B85CBD
MKKIKNKNNKYNFIEAIKLLKKISTRKFNESIDIAINLGIDPKKTDQNIKGTINLPYGNGKKKKIAVFSDKKKIIDADFIGLEDLAKKIKENKIKFDIIIATPQTMKIVGKLGPILGPKGLMPNIKFGTITNNIEKTIKKIKKGQINYKNDKNGILHLSIGKINFNNKYLKKNFQTCITTIKKNKPTTSKGIYIKKIFISSTMSPSLKINKNLYN